MKDYLTESGWSIVIGEKFFLGTARLVPIVKEGLASVGLDAKLIISDEAPNT